MKYKVGDKVKIKTWEKIKEEYRTTFSKKIEIYIDNLFPSREVIIKIVHENYYDIELIDPYKCCFTLRDTMIECLVEKYKEPAPIYDRWEILDIR